MCESVVSLAARWGAASATRSSAEVEAATLQTDGGLSEWSLMVTTRAGSDFRANVVNVVNMNKCFILFIAPLRNVSGWEDEMIPHSPGSGPRRASGRPLCRTDASAQPAPRRSDPEGAEPQPVKQEEGNYSSRFFFFSSPLFDRLTLMGVNHLGGGGGGGGGTDGGL